ncbi:Protein phosphatase PTC7 [Thelohanellus kitauei]|uniref:Protein phosphatase n=1 Tax=Thelohanellus kitauei TaxID=669202 RepID=A0A0C2N911_THEKT|nr:Protein phosphatase PTC7 [Thelohanellus kitauei]
MILTKRFLIGALSSLVATGAFSYHNIPQCFKTGFTSIRNLSLESASRTNRKFDLIVSFGGIAKNQDEKHIFVVNADKNEKETFFLKLFGEDATFLNLSPRLSFFGVADGVGGYNKYGIDPSFFSFTLMKFCLLASSQFISDYQAGAQSQKIVNEAYNTLINLNDPVLGGSTILVASFDHQTGNLNVCNLGDSKLLILRNLENVFSTDSQQHYFNCPYQLGSEPRSDKLVRLMIRPGMAQVADIELKEGDMVIIASDGFFDNVFFREIIPIVDLTKDGQNSYECCKSLLKMAREFAFDEHRQSPFSVECYKETKSRYDGGKKDDITLIFAIVVKNSHYSE